MNNQYEAQIEEDEIDLLEIFNVLKHRILFLILAFVIGAGAALGVMYFFVTPQYKATSLIYIFSKTTSITSLADLQIGSNLTADFELIAKTRDVIESVIEELELDTTYENLVKKVEVTNPTDSHMMQVTVEDPSPQLAADISNSVANKLRDQIADIMNTDKPSLVEKAVPPTQKSSPALTRNSVIAGIVALVILMIIFIARHLMDDTIKDEDDVTKYLGVQTLAAIPERRSLGKNKGGGKAKDSDKKK